MLSHFTSQSFRAGEPVPQRGHYIALHPSGAASYGQILFEAGEPFPLCSRCDNVRYQLVRSAGNILPIDQAGRNSKGQL